MDKPILFYEVRVHQNRITGGPVYVPAIVERLNPVELETVVGAWVRKCQRENGTICGPRDYR